MSTRTVRIGIQRTLTGVRTVSVQQRLGSGYGDRFENSELIRASRMDYQ